jgi:uncharacterized protein YdeI (YjbR/CyaY-like superfamily)
MPAAPSDYPVMLFADQAEWAAWLERHHASEPGVWLRLARKSSGLRSVSRAEALDVALCYGWIDGQARSHDADSWLQKFTPRRPRSLWSKVNREHVERLIGSGAMREPGLAAVESAKRDGRWDRAYDSPRSVTVPDDLQAALDRSRRASERFQALKRSDRFAILSRIQTAVKAETRARRIQDFVGRLERGEAP